MKETLNIIEAYEAYRKEGREMALATVAQVEGSSYRRAGARMLITDEGRMTGSISGGCLEGDALKKALLVIRQGRPMLVTYDTTDEEEATIGVQLGCNGVVHILIEPIDAADERNPVELLKISIGKREPSVLVTLFSLIDRRAEQPGTCFLLRNGFIVSAVKDPALELRLREDAAAVMREGESEVKTYLPHIELNALFSYTQAPLSLVVFGAGNDAMPLVEMAGILGWQVTVADGRRTHATAERFPAARSVIVTKPEEALAKVVFDDCTAVVLMSHNYNYDLAIMEKLLPLRLKYLGSLGPRKKLWRMLGELRDKGMQIDEECLKSVFGPVGLDIGSETSEEIALSIVAEIKAVFSNAPANSLRNKMSPIHLREDPYEQSREMKTNRLAGTSPPSQNK